MDGAICGANCLRSQVGTGSSPHDLVGVSFSNLPISHTVAGLKKLSGGTCRVTSTGGSARAVAGPPYAVNFAPEILGILIGQEFLRCAL